MLGTGILPTTSHLERSVLWSFLDLGTDLSIGCSLGQPETQHEPVFIAAFLPPGSGSRRLSIMRIRIRNCFLYSLSRVAKVATGNLGYRTVVACGWVDHKNMSEPYTPLTIRVDISDVSIWLHSPYSKIDHGDITGVRNQNMTSLNS